MRTLLSHLAQFSSFSSQGEVLCTQGLAYLLGQPDASTALATDLSARTGVDLSDGLTWRAERLQSDGGRPDLEACTADGKPLIKIEGKLGALLERTQLESYLDDLGKRSDRGLLVVLVPRHRLSEAQATTRASFAGLTDDGPWRLVDRPEFGVLVMTWDDVLVVLRTVDSEPFRREVDLFRSMYRVLNGYDIEPLASRDDLARWREREGVFINLVDRVTRSLSDTGVMPMAAEALPDGSGEPEPKKGYRRRYMSRPLGADRPCFSIGVRDPFRHHLTPVWLRFHNNTPQLGRIADRLEASDWGPRVVPDSGHLWLPLEVPVGADGEAMVAALLAQAEEVILAAYRSPS